MTHSYGLDYSSTWVAEGLFPATFLRLPSPLSSQAGFFLLSGAEWPPVILREPHLTQVSPDASFINNGKRATWMLVEMRSPAGWKSQGPRQFHPEQKHTSLLGLLEAG